MVISNKNDYTMIIYTTHNTHAVEVYRFMMCSLIVSHLYHDRCPLTHGTKQASLVLGCYSLPAQF